MRHDHRVPRCRAHRGVEANALEVGHVPFGIGRTFGLVSRIGRNRLDAQDREQTLESRIEICVDVGQDIIELGHGAPPEGLLSRWSVRGRDRHIVRRSKRCFLPGGYDCCSFLPRLRGAGSGISPGRKLGSFPAGKIASKATPAMMRRPIFKARNRTTVLTRTASAT